MDAAILSKPAKVTIADLGGWSNMLKTFQYDSPLLKAVINEMDAKIEETVREHENSNEQSGHNSA